MAHFVGDLEGDGVFAAALAHRATSPSAGKTRREILFFVLDARHSQWAHNLLLNLAELGRAGQALAIASSREACAKLLTRVAADTLTCGTSSFLRKAGSGANSTLTAALNRWRIRDWHVYHLWWQRWHYLAWAVKLGYNALSLDTDISLRSDPYAVFHSVLRHRHLLVGLDSEAGGHERPGLFPMINVGLVYCQDCDPDGPAHRVLSDVTRRVKNFLLGPVLYKTRHGRTDL